MGGFSATEEIYWRVASTTERDALVVSAREIGKLCLVMAGSGTLYEATAAGTGSACWNEDVPTIGSDDVTNDSGVVDGANVTDALESFDDGLNAGRSFGACKTAIAAGLLVVSDTAYWVYLGYFSSFTILNNVYFNVVTQGAGTGAGQVAFATTPAGPNRASQVLTKLAAGTATDLTAAGIGSGAVSATHVEAGSHVWAGFRSALSITQPTLYAQGGDMGQGAFLTTAAAGALTGAGPWTGAVPASALTAQVPVLLGTKDV